MIEIIESYQQNERNIYLKEVKNKISKCTRRIIQINNASLDLKLRVNFDMSDLVRTTDMELSFTDNYSKIKELQFKGFIESNYSSVNLFWIPNVNVARMDIVEDNTHCLLTNRPGWVDFLINLLSYEETDKKLEESLCVSLTSAEMVNITRRTRIPYESISKPLFYLA